MSRLEKVREIEPATSYPGSDISDTTRRIGLGGCLPSTTALMPCAVSCDHLCCAPHFVQDSQRRDRLQAQREQHARLVQDRDRAVRRAGVDLGIQIAGC